LLTETITACFERVLQHSPIGVSENFFELGGDSLLALSLLLEIKQATGRELSIDKLYDGATVEAMVALLEAEGPPRSCRWIILRQGLAFPPIFLLHGLFGNAMELVELGKHLASPRPVYAFQARGLDGQEAPNDRVEAMAEDYLAAMTQLQPSGPYILVGYSFGGLVAIEMARRLRARGDSIAFLGLIDSYPPPALWPPAARFGIFARKARLWWRRLKQMEPGEAASLVWTKVSNPSTRGLRAAASIAEIDEIELPAAIRHVREAGYRAFQSYRPSGYDGPVVFIRPETPRQFPANPRRVWQRYLRSLTIHTLPGDHFSMIDAHLGTTAHLLLQCIEDASPVANSSIATSDKAVAAALA
jgi:acetoacetyl-CoA synthetase